MNVRKIKPEDIKAVHFTRSEVLGAEDERRIRVAKLIKAVVLSNCEHQDVGIVIKLETGEVIETFCDMVDFADDFVMIKGGAIIPLKAIVDVEL